MLVSMNAYLAFSANMNEMQTIETLNSNKRLMQLGRARGYSKEESNAIIKLLLNPVYFHFTSGLNCRNHSTTA